MLKRDGGTAVYRAQLCGRSVVVKRWELRTLGARLKALAGGSRADRHWRGARWLTSHGIRTPVPYVMAVESGGGARRQYLVMEALKGRSVLEHLAAGDLTVRQEHALARCTGQVVATIWERGGFDRDGKPSNLIATSVRVEQPEVAVIDCVAIGRCRGRSSLLRMLASLYIEPLGCECPPRKALICAAFLGCTAQGARVERGASKARLRRCWGSVAELVRRHGDPRPRVDPLGSLTAGR